MSTLAFELGTASLALLIALTLKVERLLAACPKDRPQPPARIAQLRAEGAAVRAMTYRVALDSADATPDSIGSLVRLAFAEYAQRVNAAALDLFGIAAPEVVGCTASATNIWTRIRRRSRVGLRRFSATSSRNAFSVCRAVRADACARRFSPRARAVDR
jgi:alkylation response protein AidB-like acyl-CoA dehydrogenase